MAIDVDAEFKRMRALGHLPEDLIRRNIYMRVAREKLEQEEIDHDSLDGKSAAN